MHLPKGKAGPQLRRPSFPAAVMQTVLTLRMPNVIAKRRAVNETVRPRSKTPLKLRVSRELLSLWFGEKPSTDGIERSDERSDMAGEPVIEQALTFYSSGEGKEWRACIAIINIQKKCEDVTSPKVMAAFAPPARATLFPAPSTWTVVQAPRKLPEKKAEISTEKQARVFKCSPLPNAAIMLRKPMPVSAIRALPASPSSQAIPMQNTPDLVKTRQGVSRMAHQMIEIRARVSLAAMKPRLGEILFAESIERSNEYSEMTIGPAVKHALTSSSAKVER
ncbi:hypothetical protein AX14_006268 [Amanita brunnescens Koide BX004]|nr:hypothetical protein AX14_006268 [Amanita brunnescens Koide BX004]